MDAIKNIIVLTTGSSGSSLLTGVIGSKGYWLGDRTKQLDFDTYENAELVDLDREILRFSGFDRRDCNDIPPPSVEKIKALVGQIDATPFGEFVEKCNANNPWLWKDPRLSFTIHFWESFIDLKNIKFFFIEREPKQSYAGLILKRKIPMSFAQHNIMNEQYKQSCMKFFKKNGLSYFQLTFEEFLEKPERCFLKIGSFLEIEVNADDLKKIYKGKVSGKRWTAMDFWKAVSLYYVYRYIRGDYITFPRRA